MTSRLFLPGPVAAMDLAAFSGAGKNYAPNPGFELDTNADGLADGITTESTSVFGTITYERALPLRTTGYYAQRVFYTGVAGDAASAIYLWFACGASTFAPGDMVQASLLVKGIATGVTMTRKIYNQALDLVDSAAFVPTSTVTPVTATATMPAGSTSLVFAITVGEIANGDVFDLTIDDLLIGKMPA